MFGECLAAAWTPLGPSGGWVSTIAFDPRANTFLASLGYSRVATIYVRAPGASTWTGGESEFGCGYSALRSLRFREDGDVFAGCDRILRSSDRGMTWTAYSPPGATENAVFDPTRPGTAVVRGMRAYYATRNDGATWTTHPFDNRWTVIPFENTAPSQIVFDPLRPGRLLGARIARVSDAPSVQRGLIQLYESLDLGATWRVFSTIVSPDPSQRCEFAELAFDHAGNLLASTSCGLFRSTNRGNDWHELRGVAGTTLGAFVVDRIREGRIVAWAGDDVVESRDAGETWNTLPMPPRGPYRGYPSPPRDTIALDLSGDVWVATVDGVYEFDTLSRTWSSRTDGLRGVHVFLEPAPGQPPLLLAASTDVQSSDDGVSWLPWRIDSQRVRGIFRNLTNSASFFAYTEDGKLYRSDDGARTWSFVAPAPATDDYDRTYDNLIPVGTQPGLVYGLSGACANPIVVCPFTRRDVVKSTDGGVTWSRIKTDVTASRAVNVVLEASPADPRRLFLRTAEGHFRTADAGERWNPVPWLSGEATPVADAADPARWYALLRPGTVVMTRNFGDSWTDVSPTYATGPSQALLIDPRDAGRLYLVSSDASVSVSENFGSQWRTVVAADPTRHLVLPRFSTSGDAIYAGSTRGALRLDLRTLSVPSQVTAVEYYRAASDHYFITADVNEIYRLDAYFEMQDAFIRTGQQFNVWPAGANVDGATAVCRFYGKPEKQLDSHFYSASPAECQSVKDRFADSWILESADVFVVNVPDVVTGDCPAGAKPVYRLFNNRPDANHRYTTSRATRAEMLAAGWISEGYGSDGVAMCAP